MTATSGQAPSPPRPVDRAAAAPLASPRSESDGALSGAGARRLRERLLRWYQRDKRDLPWRRTRDPYAIWLSEVMLQQTRVDTVVPYYARFLARFPRLCDLAAAELEEVLAAWSGLGYYRRARALHLAAREVVARYGGELPRESDALMRLPGIGRYTAGAIASIAFSEPTPVVDGNVTRVLARVFGIHDDVSAGPTQRRLWALAAALVPDDAPGELNQALMELGATLCTPRGPQCPRCPLESACQAHRDGDPEALPRTRPKRVAPSVALVAVVATCVDGVLLARRAPSGLFGGLWEPPMVAAEGVASARGALAALGVSRRAKLEDAGLVRHALTHRRLEICVQRARPRRPWRLPEPPEGVYDGLAFCAPDDVPLSTLARKVLRAGSKTRGALLALGVLLSSLAPRPALAEPEPEPPAAPGDDGVDGEVTAEELATYRRLDREGGGYGRVLFALGGGKGFRFNNPFRLSDQLGDDAESISLTAGYVDLSLGATFGEPDGLQHGGALHFSIAAEGVSQQAFSVSYLALYRGPSAWMFHGRLGVSLLTAPDANAGGELALGVSYFFTGALGLTSELVGNLFYGAGTYEAEVTAVPVLSLQGGLIVDFEVLP